MMMLNYGGEGGIRTREALANLPPFQGGDLNRSSTSPKPEHDVSGYCKSRGGRLLICNWGDTAVLNRRLSLLGERPNPSHPSAPVL